MEKKQWRKPEFVTHGTVSELTKAKQLGFSDQFVIIKNRPPGGGSGGAGS